MKEKDELYETDISTARWLAYDIPGNAGWIIWVIFTVLSLWQGISLFSLLSALPALLMLAGVCELISERIVKLDRVLPKKRLYRGFGALTLGGMLGVPIAIFGLMTDYAKADHPIWMLIGAALCAAFAGLCFKAYQKKHR